jgi:hypothetical protein
LFIAERPSMPAFLASSYSSLFDIDASTPGDALPSGARYLAMSLRSVRTLVDRCGVPGLTHGDVFNVRGVQHRAFLTAIAAMIAMLVGMVV